MAYARETVSSIVTRQRSRKCSKCGNSKGTDAYKWCIGCRVASALQSKEWYWDHVKRKLCTRCCDGIWHTKQHGAYRMCKDHRITMNEYNREWLAERRAKGLCARCAAPSPDTYYCDKCSGRAVARKAA